MPVFLLILFNIFSQPPVNSYDIIKSMYDKNHGKWYRTLTFVQENEFYKADTVAGKSIWYEAIEYPKNFRIDIGEITDGNGVIFRNDSIYSFRGGTLKNAAPRKNNLTFLLGGMYFYSFKEVLDILDEQGYDLSKGFATSHNGRNVWVIGADNAEEAGNQLWIDSEHLFIVRIIAHENGRKMDALFEDHERLGEGWIEKKVTFYIDEKLAQIEFYKDCKADLPLDAGIFNPAEFGKVHWMAKE